VVWLVFCLSMTVGKVEALSLVHCSAALSWSADSAQAAPAKTTSAFSSVWLLVEDTVKLLGSLALRPRGL